MCKSTLFEVDDLPQSALAAGTVLKRCDCSWFSQGAFPKHTVEHDGRVYMQCEQCGGILSCEGCNGPIEDADNCGRFCARHAEDGDPLTVTCACCHSCRGNCITSLTEDPPVFADVDGNVVT